MAITCCKGCVAPKRHTACWGHCPEYLAEKAEHDRLKAEHDKVNQIKTAIIGSQMKKVYKAMKDRKNRKI